MRAAPNRALKLLSRCCVQRLGPRESNADCRKRHPDGRAGPRARAKSTATLELARTLAHFAL
eukprot:3107827-Lingulodinium_polyedra.AAC.1